MFLRIYLGVVIAVLLAGMGSYLIFNQVNEHRLAAYNHSIFAGTFTLIQEGAARHQGDKQQEWLKIVARLSGLRLELKNRSSLSLTGREIQALKRNEIIFRPTKLGDQFEVIGQVPKQPDLALVAMIQSVAEQQLRVAALLALNELGRYSQQEIPQQATRLRSIFSFPVELLTGSELQTDKAQKRRLAEGDIVVSWQTSLSGSEQILVYAPFGKSDNILVLGPIPQFSQTSTFLIVAIVAFSLLITGSIAYLLIHRVETRLKRMNKAMAQLGPADLNARIDDKGRDTIADMARSFNTMAGRIESLLTEQKHITQAVSHDLRTPIARMKFRLDLLESKTTDTSQSKQITGLRKDIKDLNNLVDEILLYHQLESSVLESAGNEPELRTVSIHQLLREVKEFTANLYPGKTLVMDLPEDIKVTAYPFYLARMLQNLVNNGLRYASEEMKIGFSMESNFYQLTFEDDGEGIPKEQWETIFNPFTRIETSRSKKMGGFGLGLAIVKRIAGMHGGTIALGESKLGGACFTFRWPKGQYFQSSNIS